MLVDRPQPPVSVDTSGADNEAEDDEDGADGENAPQDDQTVSDTFANPPKTNNG